ncbi:aquaporin [Microcoleus sp. FACHB-1515]|uniref:MIP/aquaporin family protein n=1 Tax=Cyanophyceae TaxID=3028117 RepID=UPI001685042F|nr:MIP/aquaporin family protein [Microcoleus sp. FACHB-1515]MBD2093290.1 aquaporin [Microcoleus sp. FACHB-1515]
MSLKSSRYSQSRSLVQVWVRGVKPLTSAVVIAEAIGTFVLVFAGTGAVMVNHITDGAIKHLGISLVFGAVVSALIYTLGHISGAHLNPAVTLAVWSGGFFPGHQVLPYIFAQSVGAIAASFVLWLSFGFVANLGATLPLQDNWLQSLVLEGILTFILMLVILGAGLDRRALMGFAGIAIGLTVGLEAAVMGPITGASMNPARSLGPAFVGNLWQHHWVYWVAPIVGAQLAVLVYKRLFAKGSFDRIELESLD